MKKFIIRVNGKAFDVEVEEVKCSPAVEQTENQALPDVRPASGTGRRGPADAAAAPSAKSNKQVLAPLAGTVIKIYVGVGDVVESGDVLLILEAMKMENDVVAPVAGRIESMAVVEGKIINSGDVLVTLG